MVLITDEVVQNIIDALQEADGEYLAQMHNQLCDTQVTYLGDSLFEADTDEIEVLDTESELD